VIGEGETLRDRQRAQVRADIRRAAFRLFVERGYDAVTTEEIAAAAGVSTGNISKAKHLASSAHPEVLEALRSGEVSIHRASVWLKNPEQQFDQLSLYRNMRGITRTIDSLLDAHRLSHPASEGQLDIQRIGSALAAMGPARKTSVLVGEIQVPGEVILLSRKLLHALTSQGELQL